MSLKITKDRSNLDSYNKNLVVEEFINSFLDSFTTEHDKLTSSSNEDNIFYEWDSSYKNFMQDYNKRIMSKYYKLKHYESKD